jgi:hypothetical protein
MIGKLNIQALRGDTFNEYPFEILIDNVALNLTGAVIKMDIKKDACSLPALTLTSVASAGITITNAVNGEFKINEQIISIPEGNYQYDIQITLADNTVNTWVGGLFQVINTITQ